MPCSCGDPVCWPEQLPGSRTPCMTCGQAYGQHCWDRHCAVQGRWPSRAAYEAAVAQNRVRTTAEENPESAADRMRVAFRCTGDPHDGLPKQSV